MTAGGGRSYIRNLLREIADDDRGYDFTVLCPASQLSEQETCGLPRLTLDLMGKAGLRSALRLLYEETGLPFRARGFDLLYCLADVAPAWSPVPTVVALRNLNIYDRRFFNNARFMALERLVRIGLRRARRVVVPTRAAADLIRQRITIPEERLRVVPHGIASGVFDAAPPPAAANARYLFLPSAVEDHKNVLALVEAVPLLEDPDLEVWIAGTTDVCEDYVRAVRQRIEELSLGARVRLLGPVPYEHILHYHRGAAAMVFPSLLESFGHPLLEAMLAETPVIASDIASLREVAGEVACYFDPDDPAALAAAVDNTFRDSAGTQARVELGRARAAKFSWKHSTDLLCDVFGEALSGS